ncbi:polysaccharide biosynthesis protein [Dickeya chrysanthemi Ech1591]|uniref:Polysaccharide biosynthesis protein n=1 Tax=Dickeya chrysanthemi (strain Ech1591) TaxID=561229 RepID=C6CJI2_DICC1|nr:polysaccharide biosynthesis protein [Dickeya chrysanthemi]ACT08216.1 polysaccharide biosynthesis protein [Dickeya chrysanthemi Ech1591]
MKFFISILSGSLLSQILGTGIMLALFKFYSVEAIGLYATIMAWSGLISYISALRLNLLLITNHDYEKQLLYRSCQLLSLSITIISSLVVSGSVFFLSLPLIYISIPVVIFCFSSFEILYDYHTSLGNHRKLNIIQLNRVILVGISQLVLIKFHYGLIIGTIIGSMISLLISRVKFDNARGKGLKASLKIIRNNTKYMAIHTTASIIPSIGTHLPIIFISSFFGYHASALYSIAEKITTVFVTLANSAISRAVLYSLSNKEKKVLLKYSLISITLGFIYILSSYFILPKVGFLIGDNWNDSVIFLQSLSFWFAAILILSPSYNRAIFFTVTKEIYFIDLLRFGLKPVYYVTLSVLGTNLYNIVYLTSFSMYILSIMFFIFLSLRWKDGSNCIY